MAIEAHKFETVESESRVALSDTRFSNRVELLNALKGSFTMKKIKDYEFTDFYFRPGKGGPERDSETVRARMWTKYVMGDGTQKPQHVQVVVSTPNVEVYDGLPFKMGGKKSAATFADLESALKDIESKAYVPWIIIEKKNGEHFEVSWTDGKAKVAVEDVTCRLEGRQWSSQMMEIEVSSFNKDEVAKAYTPILKVLGVGKSQIIGDPMISIAAKALREE